MNRREIDPLEFKKKILRSLKNPICSILGLSTNYITGQAYKTVKKPPCGAFLHRNYNVRSEMNE